MQIGASVSGLDRVAQSMRRLAKLHGSAPDLEVGYDTPYALRVHEDLAMPHPNGGQAKYLEQPAREFGPQIGQLVRDVLSAGRSMEDALEAAGYFLLSKSQPLVPVDSGRLVNSAYVRVK